MSFINLNTRYLGIDLGTDSIRISMNEQGIIINIPTIIAIDRKTGKLLAIGNEAKEMIGREPEIIKIIKPLKNGVIADLNATETLLKSIINNLNKKYGIARTKAILGVPSGITDVEKRAAKKAIITSGIKNVLLIEEPLADALGSGIDISSSNGYLVVDIGSGTTQAAIISTGGIVACNCIRTAGDNLNINIIDYIKKNKMLEISEICAENIKIKIGTAINKHLNTMEIIGRDLYTGLPKTIEINSKEIFEAILPSLNKIISLIRLSLEKVPPENITNIKKNGIVLTGGTANISGLDSFIKEKTGFEVKKVNNPNETMVIGAQMCFKNKEIIKKLKNQRRK